MNVADQPPTLLEFLREEKHATLPADHRVEVFVDGTRQPLAYQYSIDGGFADTYVEDEATGGLQHDNVLGRRKTRRVRGLIEIRSNDE